MLIRSVVTIYRYDRIRYAIDPEQTYNRPYDSAWVSKPLDIR